jgi:NTE family protein
MDNPPRVLAAALLASCLALLPRPGIAAEPAPKAKAPVAGPRIGLALSGGGARGLAHIGVLKVLEELRVPVHCVTGTSMGAIVGGSYASGVPAARLEEVVLGTNWDDVFTDSPPRSEISSRRKEDDYKTLFAPEYGVKDGGLALPKGLLAGVSIEAYFRALTQRAVGIENFQTLPIPFRAIATDIETGQAVVLGSGSLAQAMRASMAVPGAMAPVEIGGRLLVDGGIANNLPIDEARRLCGDVIIAVNISTPPLTRKEIASALSVSAQLLNFLGKENVDRQLKSLGDRDVLIAPELGDITSGSFDRVRDAIHTGEKAARAMAEQLRRYSLPEDQYDALRVRQVLGIKSLGTVSEIRFEGLERTNPEVLRELVQSKPGEELTEDKLGKDLRRIYGRGDFESVDYRIMEEPGTRALIIQAREKSWGPDYLRFGVGLASDFHGQNPFSILVQYRKTWLNKLGGEWLSEFQVGRTSRVFTEFYQPVDERGRYFVAPYVSLSQATLPVFIGDTRFAEYNVDEARVGLDVGTVLGTLGELRLGALWYRVKASPETGLPGLPSLKEESAGVRARLFVDHLDHAFFARNGYRATASGYVADESFGSDHDYKRLEGQLVGAVSWGANTFNLSASGGTNLGTELPAYEYFRLGGPLRLSGYQIDEFSGQNMSLGRLMYYRRAVHLPDILGSGIYYGGSLEVGRISQPLLAQNTVTGTIWSGSVFLGADTFLGPLYLGLGFAEGGRNSLYLLLGVP